MEIAILGAGNVAYHLGKALCAAGHHIVGLYVRNAQKANGMAAEMSTVCKSLDDDVPPCDVCLIAVSDNAIAEVATKLSSKLIAHEDTIVVHTSGATDMSALSANRRYGVLYPCQTFSASDTIDVSKTPFLVEASDEDGVRTLMRLANSISSQTPCEADSQSRAMLHLAAVFASNFTNHNLLIAQRLLQASGMPLDTLRVLVEQTVEKAFRLGPYDAQTGPARRHDSKTLERHLAMIQNPSLKNVYQIMTESIAKEYDH